VLHGVDHADVGPLALERGADGLELGLGEDLDLLGASEPGRPELDLRCRLLTGDEQRAPILRHRGQRAEQERRLPDSRFAAEQHERRRDEPAAEHAVELRHAGRDPRGLLDLDVDQPEKRPGGPGAPSLPCGSRRRLLDERAESVAARALAEPASGGVPAVGTEELNCRLGHWIESRSRSRQRLCRISD